MGNKTRYEVPATSRICSFHQKIVNWFDKNKRDYPWRRNFEPFRTLIAELMLRRTRADQVTPIYEEFFRHYPDIESLVATSEQEVRILLNSLGLRWRVPAFIHVAKEIIDEYHGVVPRTREELLGLSGVGDYVAGAVLSLAYNKQEWIVDSNIVRLFRRFFGIETSKEGRRDKHVIEIAKIYVSCGDPRNSNLAILDFSALICTPRNPKHNECVLKSDCQYILHS